MSAIMRENVFVFKKCTQKYQIRTSSFVSAVSISEHVSYESWTGLAQEDVPSQQREGWSEVMV